MKKKIKSKDGFMKYFIRGFILSVLMWIITVPITFIVGLFGLFGGWLIVVPLLIIYLVVVFPISGFLMTKIVREWVK